MPPPTLTRGFSKEEVKDIHKQVKHLDRLVKQLSTDGSTLQQALSESPTAQDRQSRAANGVKWSNMPVREIVKMQGLQKGPAFIDASMEGYTQAHDHLYESSAKVTSRPMRELVEEEEANARSRKGKDVAAQPPRKPEERPAPAPKALSRRTAPRRQATFGTALTGFEWLQSGDEWIEGVLPLIADALVMLIPTGETAAERKRELVSMAPSRAVQYLHDVCHAKANDLPVKRGAAETPAHVTLRGEHQVFTDAPILPKSQAENEEMFKLRLKVFKPDRRRNVKRNVLVLPQRLGETAADFETRMSAQSHTAFIILPRIDGETRADYETRIDAIRENSPFWHAAAPEVTPPLVVPRGKHETEESFAARLDMTCSLPSGGFAGLCLAVLPQGHDEDDDHVAERLRRQATLAETIAPFDASSETDADWSARLSKQSARDSVARNSGVQRSSESRSSSGRRSSAGTSAAAARVSGAAQDGSKSPGGARSKSLNNPFPLRMPVPAISQSTAKLLGLPSMSPVSTPRESGGSDGDADSSQLGSSRHEARVLQQRETVAAKLKS